MTTILGISLDQTLAFPDENHQGDSIQRNIKYAKVLKKYYLVVYTPHDRNLYSPIHWGENVYSYPTNSYNKATFFLDAWRIGCQICENEDIDLVYTQDIFATGLVGYWLKQRYKLPLCFSFAGDMLNNPYWLRERLLHHGFNALGKWLLKKGDVFRVVSMTEEQKLIRLGVCPDKIWNIGWINDFRNFLNADGTSIRNKYLKDGNYSKILLFAGRLVPQKDLPTLLKAMQLLLKIHPDALLLIVGEGVQRQKLIKMAHELGVNRNVVFTGAINYDEIPSYFAAADVFVLSSTYEGNARVLAEAAASGKPVVSTDISGTRDSVIDGVTGYIVGPRNPQQLADRITRILDNPAIAREMGLRGRQHILSSYTEDTLLPRFKEMWETTVKRYQER